jgi:hypothetical protein
MEELLDRDVFDTKAPPGHATDVWDASDARFPGTGQPEIGVTKVVTSSASVWMGNNPYRKFPIIGGRPFYNRFMDESVLVTDCSWYPV